MTTDEAATPPAVGPDGNDFGAFDDTLDDDFDSDVPSVEDSGHELSRDVSL